LTGGEDLWLAMDIGNEALNPGAQLMHPASIAKVTEVLLAPGHLSTAKALVDLIFRLAVISFLMLRR
jgi:hypothetical protein